MLFQEDPCSPITPRVPWYQLLTEWPEEGAWQVSQALPGSDLTTQKGGVASRESHSTGNYGGQSHLHLTPEPGSLQKRIKMLHGSSALPRNCAKNSIASSLHRPCLYTSILSHYMMMTRWTKLRGMRLILKRCSWDFQARLEGRLSGNYTLAVTGTKIWLSTASEEKNRGQHWAEDQWLKESHSPEKTDGEESSPGLPSKLRILCI